jgi:hypothetical protein
MAEPVAIYSYRDHLGGVLFKVLRYEPKSFRLIDPHGTELTNFPRQLVLYRLPELLAAEPAETVYMVEGEKDADLLASLGFLSTTNPGGTRLGWQPHYKQWLENKHVVILPDADRPGKKHAAGLAAALRPAAASALIVELPGLHGNQDVSDWLVRRTASELLEQVTKARYASAGLGRRPIKRDQEALIFGSRLPSAARLLLLALRHRMEHGIEGVSATVKELAEQTGQHRVSTQNLLTRLRNLAVVRRTPVGHAIAWDILAVMQRCTSAPKWNGLNDPRVHGGKSRRAPDSKSSMRDYAREGHQSQ